MLVLSIMLLAVTVSAQTPGVPQGGGACITEEDCSLGGLCVSSRCVCDAWFTGPSCALLNLVAQDGPRHGTCGDAFASYYSWGGRMLPPTPGDSGLHHAYISFMCQHKTLGSWTTASASAHFVSDTLAGEYRWSPEQCSAAGVCVPSVIPWSHNTVAVTDARFPSDAAVQIWHVGDGVVPASVWSPCWNASEAGPHARVEADGPPAAFFSEGSAFTLAAAASPGNTAYVTVAPTPDGPWTRALDNQGVAINFTGSWTGALAGNPAPLVMPDGSINLYFTAVPCPPNSGAKASNCIAVATSRNGFEGPFEMNAAPHPITYPESEDPSVFRDPRGNYHLLTNVNTCHARCPQGVECGGHAWSRDGFVFSNLTVGAFGPYITFANGTAWPNAYVERPLVTQAADGTPLAFYVGMGRTRYEDSCNWPQLFCTGAPGEVCGPTLTPPRPTPTPSPTPLPPSPPLHLRHGGGCLQLNLSALAAPVRAPCWDDGGINWGCSVYVGDCAAPGAVWRFSSGALQSAVALPAPHGASFVALNADCDKLDPATPVWALAGASGSAALRLELTAQGTLHVVGSADACLGAASRPAHPCGPQQRWPLEGMATIVSCKDPSAAGWSAANAGAP